jgi:hypothetical protein
MRVFEGGLAVAADDLTGHEVNFRSALRMAPSEENANAG